MYVNQSYYGLCIENYERNIKIYIGNIIERIMKGWYIF